jgi:hypothetical protein
MRLCHSSNDEFNEHNAGRNLSDRYSNASSIRKYAKSNKLDHLYE